jgi:bifunctional DNase/RNase
MRRGRARDAWSWEALHGGRWAAEPLDKRAGPEELAEAADLARSVRYAVADLPVGQRAAMALVYLSGLTQAEAAAMLGIEVGAVKARLHKARATLRRRLWARWKEVPMTPAVQAEAVEMRVADVRRRPAEGDRPARYIIVLEEVTGTRNLSIWVGEFEGQSIAMLLEDVQVPRPLTFTFVASLLQAGGARLQEVRVHRLEEKTYYAVAVVEGAAGTRTVDARPSDAFALALVTGAPIYVAPAVLETSDAAEPTRPVSREEMVRTSIGSAEIVTDIIDKWPVEPKPTRRTG